MVGGLGGACQPESALTYGDVIVIDISRNLLLIMSNRQHVTQNNHVTCLLYSKYRMTSTLGIIFIPSRFNHLRGILFKLFRASILGTRLHTAEIILF
jgi:hypothetical protein